MLRIIGKLAAEFNTCLKLIIGKRARDNFEKSGACDEQHGFRPHRSAQDAMMLKLLTYESARMQRCTIGSLQHDMTAHFDLMKPELTTVLATNEIWSFSGDYEINRGYDCGAETQCRNLHGNVRRDISTRGGRTKAGWYGTGEG